MPINDDILYNYLLTQKSVNGKTPYDDIEKAIEQAITLIKKENFNAKITNIIFNIDGKLVPAQIYIERKNGFASSRVSIFGTSPTFYQVQLRFPFGIEMHLGKELVYLPSGDFEGVLEPYLSGGRVLDNVQRDANPADLVIGSGVERTIEKDKITLKCLPEGQTITFPYTEELGKGWERVPGCLPPYDKEYKNLDQYKASLKINGVYPLFYFSKDEKQPRTGLLRRHTEYQDAASDTFLSKVNEAVLSSEAGKTWEQNIKQKSKEQYVFNINKINGITLLSHLNLPVIRLRDYQLELFCNSRDFIQEANNQNKGQSQQLGLAGTINMGVGAGKTFCIFTLLQHLKHEMQSNKLIMAPAFCVAPDEAIAKVIAQSINRQGAITGTSAISISNGKALPSPEFLKIYQQLTKQASTDAEAVNKYINNELQDAILNFCHQRHLHLNRLINLWYATESKDDLAKALSFFKDSLDTKRLLLLIEGYKTIMGKTGMSGITALYALRDQFIQLETTLRNPKENPFLRQMQATSENKSLDFIYDQVVKVPASAGTPFSDINVAKLNPALLKTLLYCKCKNNLYTIRDHLLKITCLNDRKAAVLLANSGGLGNTTTEGQLESHIKELLPIAAQEITRLANKKPLSLQEHFLMRAYLNEIFSSIPEELKADDLWKGYNLIAEGLQINFQLVINIRQVIEQKINSLASINTIPAITTAMQEQYGIHKDAKVIEVANQLAGIASLQVTGAVDGSDAKLLLTHIPVFTPEGLAAYFKHLGSLENNNKMQFKEHLGLYMPIATTAKITKKDIANRLQQILNAVLVADEIHHEAFKFLYDTNHPLYQQINEVTERFLNKQFITVLPHRIGMSGTINESAKRAFPGKTLYDLSTQKMIQQDLIKQISIDTPRLGWLTEIDEPQLLKQEYAMQIVVDYFIQDNKLSIETILGNDHSTIDLFALSKGLIFSKTTDNELNNILIHYFNLLIQDPAQINEQDKKLQQDLFKRINGARQDRAGKLTNKVNGKTKLSHEEIELIERYNQTRKAKPAIQIKEGKIEIPARKQIVAPELNHTEMQLIHRNAFKNNLFALYLEYILSKSTGPKELSDLIGLQNKLFEKGLFLFQLDEAKKQKEVKNILSLIQNVDPNSISSEDIHKFLNERIRDGKDHSNTDLREHLKIAFFRYKNNYNAFIAEAFDKTFEQFPLTQLISTDRNQFEAGTTMAMIGSQNERTGYSHEPVGIVIDAPSNAQNLLQINTCILERARRHLTAATISTLFTQLQTLAKQTLSYDEKNQAGGRALRTPYGHVKYIQYQTKLANFIQDNPKGQPILSLLKVETAFENIFTSNEKRAQEERKSITFNRECFFLIEKQFKNLNAFSRAVQAHFAKESTDPVYTNYANERLPLLWAMKYHPNLAANYFKQLDPKILEAPELRQNNALFKAAEDDPILLASQYALRECEQQLTMKTINKIQEEFTTAIAKTQLEQQELGAIVEKTLVLMLQQICDRYESALYLDLSKKAKNALGSPKNSMDLSIEILEAQRKNLGFFNSIYNKDKSTINKLLVLKELKNHLNPEKPDLLSFQQALQARKINLEERRINILLALCTLGLSILLPKIFNKVQGKAVTEILEHSLTTINYKK